MFKTIGANILRFYHPGLTPNWSDYNWTDVQPNQWYFVSLVYNGTSAIHYINSVLKQQTTVTGTPTTNTNNLFIGVSM